MTRDPLDDLGPGDRGLVELFSQLTSEPSPDELSGEYAALTMFRTVRGAPAAPSAVMPSPTRHRRASRARVSSARLSGGRIGARLVAAASVVALGGGFAAAAYAEALPAPLQHVAHQILGFAGVPNSPTSKKQTVPVASHSSRGGSNSAQPTSSRSPGSSSPSPHQSSSGSPSPAGSVTITAAQSQITAGGSVKITATFTRRGRAITGVPLSLAELAAGKKTTWRVVGQATTGPGGQAGFTARNVITNASFRVTGPGGSASGDLSIVVIPTVTLSQVPGSHGQPETLVVSAPLAQHGDVVQLEYQAGGQWRQLRTHRLRRGGQIEFSVLARKISVTYRVVLPVTAEHGAAFSPQVTVAARTHKGGHGRG